MNEAPDREPVVVSEPVMTAGERRVFYALSAAGLAAILWFAAVWSLIGIGESATGFILGTALLGVVLINNQGRWLLLLAMRRPRRRPAPQGLHVALVTTCVPAVEPLDMVEATLRAMVAIEYPHDTWLLDEGDDPALRELCSALGVIHFTRRHREEYQADQGVFQRSSKHGNYNAWLHEAGYSRYDFLIAFDPDHQPLPSYASEVLGYFDDPTVGYVQPAQGFYNQSASLIARGAAEETYAYFSSVQMAAYALGYPIIVGSHNAHRMRALQEVGGFAAHDADDLLLTLKYRTARWTGVYLPQILARGLTPVDWRSYLVQQRRWARSVLDIKLKRWDDYSSRLPLRSQIMSFLHGINFLHRAVVFVGVLVVLLYLLATAQSMAILDAHLLPPAIVLGAVLVAEESFRQRFYIGAEERGVHWRSAVLEYAKWPWFVVAVFDVVTARKFAYVITRKTPHGAPYRPVIGVNLGLITLIVGAWLIGRQHGPSGPVSLVLGAIFVVLSAVVVLTAIGRAPPPYQHGLWHPPRTRQPASAEVA